MRISGGYILLSGGGNLGSLKHEAEFLRCVIDAPAGHGTCPAGFRLRRTFIETARKPQPFKAGDEWQPGAKPEFHLA